MATKFPIPVSRLKFTVPYRRKNLKHPDEKNIMGRHIRIQEIMTSLFREERIEIMRHEAVECRQYAERLIQLAIQYGDYHKPTMKMADFWLLEKDLVHKLFKVYVPRFQNCSVAFTRMFRLPSEYFEYTKPNWYYPTWASKKWRFEDRALLELRGNPYPPVISESEQHSNSLLNILLENAKKQHRDSKMAKKNSVKMATPDPSIATSASHSESIGSESVRSEKSSENSIESNLEAIRLDDNDHQSKPAAQGSESKT